MTRTLQNPPPSPPLVVDTSHASSSDGAIPLAPDTPLITKHSFKYEAFGTLGDGRTAVMADIGHVIKEISLDTFKADLLPALDKAIDIDRVSDTLRQGDEPILQPVGWTDFKTEPKNLKADENEVYKSFTKIIDAIINARPSQRHCCISYAQFPCKGLLHTLEKNTGKPDGYFYMPLPYSVPSANADDIYWQQIICSAQFKKENTSILKRNDNIMKICSDMVQIMRDDPARRFTYGFTVENLTMRLWYCDRSEIIVSEGFHIMIDYKHLLHFILSIAYPASLWDIGVDQTMTPRGPHEYDIVVHDTNRGDLTFRTLECLYYFQARAVGGRCTRVWKVRRVRGGELYGDPLVLKDTWIDSERTREGDIMEAIMADAADAHRSTLQNLLLTVVCHGDVIGPMQVLDMTYDLKNVPWRLFEMRKITAHENRAYTISHDTRTASGSYLDRPRISPENSDKPTDYGHRTHYRIVFQEVGESLHRVKSMRTVFKALHMICVALWIIHSAGWTHRDISSHNIIWVNGRAKLADFEYARKKGDTSQYKLRTVSDFFQASEVESKCYTFLKAIVPDAGRVTIRDMLYGDDFPSSQSSEVEPPSKAVVPTSDKEESLWWVAVYFMLYRDIQFAGPRGLEVNYQSPEKLEEQHHTAVKIFEAIDRKMRNEFLTSVDRFHDTSQCLHKSVLHAVEHLDNIRINLVEAYRKLELDVTKIPTATVPEELYSSFADSLTAISKSTDRAILLSTHVELVAEGIVKLADDAPKPDPNKPVAGSRATDASVTQQLQSANLGRDAVFSVPAVPARRRRDEDTTISNNRPHKRGRVDKAKKIRR
ncbi:hypothetical protein NM688_g2555 [Phlebia brevispora]|uniref:Uncharacterized protein n=1 Tax=Phlebia brevispora TaxID=194682 RepID=A0ACC1T8M4_9APHY|nr:hypothetical protein NM688_g2555 [Phlebia brevispora]